jgi:hypothetical protein
MHDLFPSMFENVADRLPLLAQECYSASMPACGDHNQHYYGQGDVCACGQVPNRLVTAPLCDCGGNGLRPPEHQPLCRAVLWAKDRNEWVTANPGVDPLLPMVPERKVRVGNGLKGGA